MPKSAINKLEQKPLVQCEFGDIVSFDYHGEKYVVYSIEDQKENLFIWEVILLEVEEDENNVEEDVEKGKYGKPEEMERPHNSSPGYVIEVTTKFSYQVYVHN